MKIITERVPPNNEGPTNPKRGEYYHFEFELTKDDKGGFNIFCDRRLMRKGSSLTGVKEFICDWLEESFKEED